MYRTQFSHKRLSLKFKCCYYLPFIFWVFVVQSTDSTWYNKELLPSNCLFCIPPLKANYIQSVKQALYAIFQMMKMERSLCIYLMYLDVSRCLISWIK